MKQAIVDPDPQQPFGHALVRFPGAAAGLKDPRFLIRRPDFERGVLGPGGWQAADAYLSPLSAEVKGQESVKRALEIASAGGHNVRTLSPL